MQVVKKPWDEEMDLSLVISIFHLSSWKGIPETGVPWALVVVDLFTNHYFPFLAFDAP
jgi:hypothetical protein